MTTNIGWDDRLHDGHEPRPSAVSAMRALALVQRFLNPEDLGHAVSAEVRDLAREVLGRPRVETVQKHHHRIDLLGEPPAENCNTCRHRPLEVYESPCHECLSMATKCTLWEAPLQRA